MTDLLHYPTRPAQSFPPLDKELDFDARLCQEIAGKDIPRRPAKRSPPSETPMRPLFDPSM